MTINTAITAKKRREATVAMSITGQRIKVSEEGNVYTKMFRN
jgi:hypothetical protein